MSILPSYSKMNLIGFGIALLAILGSIFLQFHYHIEPCPLCIVQRLLMVLLALLFLIASLHTPQPIGRRIFGCVLCFFALLGFGTAAWQVWLQHLPAGQAPGCGASLEYMLSNLPFYEMVKMVLQGSAECAKVTWSFLGLSMAELSAVVFFVLAVIAATHIFRKK
jgi:disulfide bond formation protein DsbB